MYILILMETLKADVKLITEKSEGVWFSLSCSKCQNIQEDQLLSESNR